MLCPITSSNRKRALYVPIVGSASVPGFILVEQLRSLDYRVREGRFVDHCDEKVTTEVLAVLDSCIY